MKNVKPMLGAMSVVGKDLKGQKLILPTENFKVIKEPIKRNNVLKRFISTFINAFKGATGKGQLDKRRVLSKRHAEFICNDYNQIVSKKIYEAQEKGRKNKRAALGLNY